MSGTVGLLLGGVVLGLSVAAPLGPVNLEMIRRGLGGGFGPALWVGIGSTIADLFYILAAYAGADPLSHHIWARGLLFASGTLVLCYLGVGSIRAALVRGEMTSGIPEAPAVGRGRGAFAAGFLITILNPMTIAFWLGLLAAALAARPREGVWVELLYVGSLVTGCLLWVFGLAGALHYGRRVVRGPALRLVSIGAGIVLIGFGLRFAVRAARAVAPAWF